MYWQRWLQRLVLSCCLSAMSGILINESIFVSTGYFWFSQVMGNYPRSCSWRLWQGSCFSWILSFLIKIYMHTLIIRISYLNPVFSHTQFMQNFFWIIWILSVWTRFILIMQVSFEDKKKELFEMVLLISSWFLYISKTYCDLFLINY
jgi:hypothetical protein